MHAYTQFVCLSVRLIFLFTSFFFIAFDTPRIATQIFVGVLRTCSLPASLPVCLPACLPVCHLPAQPPEIYAYTHIRI